MEASKTGFSDDEFDDKNLGMAIVDSMLNLGSICDHVCTSEFDHRNNC